MGRGKSEEFQMLTLEPSSGSSRNRLAAAWRESAVCAAAARWRQSQGLGF